MVKTYQGKTVSDLWKDLNKLSLRREEDRPRLSIFLLQQLKPKQESKPKPKPKPKPKSEGAAFSL